jgi:glycosyltransferase involved in cell wall biosynthesis
MNRRIKVAQVITRMDWGGSPDIFRIICQRLDPRRYDFRVIVGEIKNPTARSKAFLAKYSDALIVIPELKRDINLFMDLATLVKLYFIFKKERFDIVHSHTAKAGALARIAARLAGVAVIIHTPHGHNFYGYFKPFMSKVIIFIERLLTKITDKIMVLTELEKNDYIRFKVAQETKLKLIYTGLELEEFGTPLNDPGLKEGFGIKTDELVIGFVGRLEPIKGLLYLALAAKIVLGKKDNVRFIFVGEGSLKEELRSVLSRWSGPVNKVIFTGWREDIAQLMSMFDILVLPSLNEAVGLVLIEAQSQGVCVVATKVGGIPEIVRDKQTGILVEPEDSQALAEAIIFLLDNQNQRKAYAQAGQRFVKDRFNAQTLAENVLRMYEEELKNKHVNA